jgi:glycosyltransferase involved in cell wall biosynthesis
MPVFNAEPFLAQAIESVLAQDHPAFELLIGDDASTDGSPRIIDAFRRDPRVKVMTHRRNQGAAATRNALIRRAAGRYITPCDADDLMAEGNLSTLSRFLDDHPAVGAVYGDILELFVDGSAGRHRRPKFIGRDCGKTWDLIDNAINHGGSMIRRAPLLRVGGYDASVRTVDDWSMWIKLAEIVPIHYLEGAVLYVWRRHAGGQSRRARRRAAADIEAMFQRAVRRRGLAEKR